MSESAQIDLFADPVPSFLKEAAQPSGNPYGLRYYQRDAKAAAEESFERVDSTMLVMATGTGKTQVFGAIAGDFDGRVLILCHRDELIQQAMNRLEEMTMERIGLEQGEFRSGKERIVIGSVQTVYRKERLEHLSRRGGFGLVVADEFHHYVAKTYRRALEHFDTAKRLGVTATPDRADELALGQICDEVAYQYDIDVAIEDGYLVPIIGQKVFIESLDLSSVGRSGKDLNLKQLDEVMMKAVEGIVKAVLDRWPDRCGPAFFPRKRSAEYACERFNALSPGCATVITDDTPPIERRRRVAACKRGDFQYLCNCMIATEGFDWPEANLMIGGRPTKSRALFSQMVGRTTRTETGLVDSMDGKENAEARRAAIAASSKPDCIVADFVGNAGKHALTTVEDVLGGRYTEAEVKVAKKKAEQQEGGNPQDLLEQARAELKAMAAAIKSTVEIHTERFDPFRTLHLSHDFPRDDEMSRRYGEKPASDKQVSALQRFGLTDKETKGLSKMAATKLMGAMIVRRKKDLATYKQLKVLQKWGVGRTNMSFKRASSLIDYLASTGWGKKKFVDPLTIAKLLG